LVPSTLLLHEATNNTEIRETPSILRSGLLIDEARRVFVNFVVS